jgi:hypothetical protein
MKRPVFVFYVILGRRCSLQKALVWRWRVWHYDQESELVAFYSGEHWMLSDGPDKVKGSALRVYRS